MNNHGFFGSKRFVFGTLALAAVIGPIGCLSSSDEPGQEPQVFEETEGLLSESESSSEASARHKKPRGKRAILELAEDSSCGSTSGSGSGNGSGSGGGYGSGSATTSGGTGSYGSTTVASSSSASSSSGGGGAGGFGSSSVASSSASGCFPTTVASSGSGNGGAGGFGSSVASSGSGNGGTGGFGSSVAGSGSGASSASASGSGSSGSGGPGPNAFVLKLSKDGPICGAQNDPLPCDDWQVTIRLDPALLPPGKIPLFSPNISVFFQVTEEDDGSHSCGFGGGNFIPGTIEILRVEPEFVVFKLRDTELFFGGDIDGRYVASRCATP